MSWLIVGMLFLLLQFLLFDKAALVETRTSRDEMADDHILFQTAEVVDRAGGCRFDEHSGRLLEGGRRDERLGGERSLRDSEENWLRFSLFSLLHVRVRSREFATRHDFTNQEVGSARLRDHHVRQHA